MLSTGSGIFVHPIVTVHSSGGLAARIVTVRSSRQNDQARHVQCGERVVAAGERIAWQCARNAVHWTSSSVWSVAQLFESRMTTPPPARPTSTQFLPGLQRLDLNQVRPSVAMAALPTTPWTPGIILPPEYSRRQPFCGINGRYVTFNGQILDKIRTARRDVSTV